MAQSKTVWPATYSKRTVCPECHSRIRLEDVRFTPQFKCPICQKNIRVSSLYSKLMQWLSYGCSAVVLYLLGLRLWLVFVCWLPAAMVGIFLWAYAGKYLVPPKLQRVTPDSQDLLQLGIDPGQVSSDDEAP